MTSMNIYPPTGQVLKAWDIGVMSMQKGEVCMLLCKPDYAYGPSGNSDKIPPNSSVMFEVSVPCCCFLTLNIHLFEGFF